MVIARHETLLRHPMSAELREIASRRTLSAVGPARSPSLALSPSMLALARLPALSLRQMSRGARCDRSRLKPVRAILSRAGQQPGVVRCAVIEKPAEEPGFGVGSCVAEDALSSGSVLAKLGLHRTT
jgi:hypothetical protein